LQRLAEGARNAEIAGEFGISPKQVQGLRMGCSREIARRAELAGRSPRSDRHEHASKTASVDEIVRYLRQQDDVVVLQEGGGYLVNGRFRLSAAELIARANRMRSRQHKLQFGRSSTDFPLETSAASKGHPLFWESRHRPSLLPMAIARSSEINNKGAQGRDGRDRRLGCGRPRYQDRSGEDH
jgi:hypothetical protein